MKFSYASSVISFYLLLSQAVASPAIHPGSTTLSRLSERDVSSPKTMTPRAIPLSTGAGLAGPRSGRKSSALGPSEESILSKFPHDVHPHGKAPSSRSHSASKGRPRRETHRVLKASPRQGNLCKTGETFCCNEEDGRNNCIKSRTSCDQTVICCNNEHGYQFCMGDINFNMPVTFNINFDFS